MKGLQKERLLKKEMWAIPKGPGFSLLCFAQGGETISASIPIANSQTAKKEGG